MIDETPPSAMDIRLRTLVERVVRPVKVTHGRRRQLREELLAHLDGVFEEELALHADAETAYTRSAARFGAPADLTRQLQASIPRWNRVLGRLQYVPSPRDFAPLGVVRALLVFTAATYALLFSAVLLLSWWQAPHRWPISPFYGLTVMAVTSVICTIPFIFVSERLGAVALAGRLSLNWRSALLILAAALYLPLWFTLVYWGLAGEFALPWNVLWPVYFAGPLLGPLLAVVQGRRFVQDRDYFTRWAELELD